MLHLAVHTVYLFDAKQMPEETVKAFSARVWDIAASCKLTKTCPHHTYWANMSFLEETVYNTVLSGLRDWELQERCLYSTYMKTVTNFGQLIKFCSTEKASNTPGSGTKVLYWHFRKVQTNSSKAKSCRTEFDTIQKFERR